MKNLKELEIALVAAEARIERRKEMIANIRAAIAEAKPNATSMDVIKSITSYIDSRPGDDSISFSSIGLQIFAHENDLY